VSAAAVLDVELQPCVAGRVGTRPPPRVASEKAGKPAAAAAAAMGKKPAVAKRHVVGERENRVSRGSSIGPGIFRGSRPRGQGARGRLPHRQRGRHPALGQPASSQALWKTLAAAALFVPAAVRFIQRRHSSCSTGLQTARRCVATRNCCAALS